MHNTPLAVTASEPDVPSSGPDKAASTAFGIKRGNRTTDDVVHVSIYVCTHVSHHQLYAMSFSRVKKHHVARSCKTVSLEAKAWQSMHCANGMLPCPRTVVLGMPCVCLQPRIRPSFPQNANQQSLLRPHAILGKETSRRTERSQMMSWRQQMCGASTILAAAQHVLCGRLVP